MDVLYTHVLFFQGMFGEVNTLSGKSGGKRQHIFGPVILKFVWH